MARANVVVQGERLRDQVYRLIREDLKLGRLRPGQRVVEAELAERYNVSRTPVREALFQLSRDGMMTPADDRGYIIPVDTPDSAAARHEVRDLLDPRLASHAATEGTSEQRKALAKAFERQKAAHDAGKIPAFIDANQLFRTTLQSMCKNQLLVRCSALIDDHAQPARLYLFRHAEFRAVQLKYDEALLKAIEAGDAPAAEAVVHDYVSAVRPLSAWLPPAAQTDR